MSLESSSGPATTVASSSNSLRDDATTSTTTTNHTSHHHENGVIGSLGNALAGVTIGSTTGNKSAFVSGIPFSTNVASTSATAGQGHHNSVPPASNSGGWGRFPSADAPVPLNSFVRPNSSSSNNKVREESTRNPSSPSVEPPTPEHVERKQSIDLFLSRTPSEMLGNDVFKELSTGNLPGLAIPEEGDRAAVHENPGASSTGNFRNNFGGAGGQSSVLQPSVSTTGTPSSHQEQRRGSPSSNITGTTASNTTGTGSRSNSPYDKGSNNHGGHTINAYNHSSPSAGVYQPLTPGTSTASTNNRVENGTSQRPPSSYNNNNNSNFNQQYNPSVPNKHVQTVGGPINSIPIQQQIQPQQPQQILYMAVPTPDGRQVLQPVQMVQMPGKPFAYVLPGTEGMPAMQGAIPSMQAAPQPMMVLPTMVPQQCQLAPPIGVSPRQQQQGMISHQPTTNLNPNGLVGGNDGGGRNAPHQNKNAGVGIGYSNPHNDISGGGGAYTNHIPPGGLGGNDEYSTMQGQGGIENDPQYLNQPTDPTLASLYSTPQRPPLDALLGQVRRLSRDQVGCRLVQQALDEEGPMAATLILNEGLPFWGEAMVDPFGNYLFQKILEKITANERIMLVKSVSTRLVNASLNLHGTRSVQKIVELCTIDEENKSSESINENGGDGNSEETASDVLTQALTPAAARLCIDSHGNHVIQRILLKLGHKHSKFVFDAVAESVGDVARHRHGCCVIQRCLDSPPGPARSNLVRRIVDKSLELMQDAYGNYVVQYVLDVCSDDDVHAVCESVIGKVNLLAIQKFSSNVMEKCLERCTDRVKEHYMQELSDPERIRELMMDPFGNYVVQRALSVATHTQAVRLVEAMKPHLIAQAPGTPDGQRNGGVRNTAGGRRIMAKICRRFPNFNLDSTGSREEIYSQNRNRHQHHSNHHNQSTNLATTTMYSIPQLSPAPVQVIQQQPHQHQHQHQHQPQQQIYSANQNITDYATNPLAINQLNMGGLQFDQRQSYYDVGTEAGYFPQQHTPHFGQGAYPNGV